MTFSSTMRKYVSIQAMRQMIVETVRRFPLPLLITVSGSVIWTIVLEQDISADILVRVLWTLGVALPLFIALAVLAESDRWSRGQIMLLHGLALIGCVGFWWGLPADMDFVPFADIIRSLLLAGATILLLLIAGVVAHKQSENDFWQYAVRVFSDVILSGALGGVLFIGLTAALSTIDFLFDVNVPDQRFGEAAIFALGIFAMTFFLARFPHILPETNDTGNLIYRKEFTLLAQYVLLPLVALYFVIMYVYGFNIVITGEWPDGSVSNFIIAFAIIGIFAYMLLYPRLAEKRWLRICGTVFYSTLLPLIGLLFWAIILRIQQYAWTERRYLTVVFGVWLIAACAYFLISKRKDIRLVPVSLTIVLVLTSFGPWDAFAISRTSQMNRLFDIAERNQLVSAGYLIAKAEGQKINFEDRKELSAIMDYLYERHGLPAIEEVFNKDLSAYEATYDKYNVVDKIVIKELKLHYIDEWERITPAAIDTENGFRYYSARDYVNEYKPEPLSVTGYDYMIAIQPNYDDAKTATCKGETTTACNDKTNTFKMNERTYNLNIDMPTNQISLTDTTTGQTVSFDFTEQLKTLFTTYPENVPVVPRDALHFVSQPNDTADFTLDLYLEEIGMEVIDSHPKLNTLYGQLFVTFK